MILHKIKQIIICLLFFSFQLAEALSPQDNLKDDDIQEVMESLFDYHVDQKAITPNLIKRSFRIYLQQFDSKKEYLLQEEVSPHLNPTEATLSKSFENYNNHSITQYQTINKLIEKSIERNRKWREKISTNLDDLIAEAEKRKREPPKEKKERWAENKEALRKRVEDNFIQFITAQLEDGLEPSKENQSLLFELYDKRIRSKENEYLFIDEEGNKFSPEKQEHTIVLRTLKALAKSLDSHTAFFSGQEAYDMRIQLEKGFQGIGIILQESVEGVKITRLIKGGPAERSGLIKEQDIIVNVDGHDLESLPFKKVLELIRGEGNSLVSLGLKRKTGKENQQTSEIIQIELKRGKVVIDEKRVDVSQESFGDGIIGKITLYSFYDGEEGINSEHDIREAIRNLKREGNLKGIVLDLRENLGGFLMQAVKVAGLFITNGVVVVAKYSTDEYKFFRDIDGYAYYDGPLVVLVSKASASAAEIVAQTLQDYGAAIVVGDAHTYGKGSIQHQTVTNEDADSFFKVTVGRYYTVSGKSTQIDGVISDIVVPTNYSNKRIGEQLLDYPLPSDTISPSFEDMLADLDWESKRWYVKYYLPSLQKKELIWKEMLPTLVQNSERRLKNNKNFQFFLEKQSGESASVEEEDEELLSEEEEENYGAEDLQMVEAVNILKDMVILQPENPNTDDPLYALKLQKNKK